MSEPAIAHRCPSCGVAIRDQAFFCPQCGKPLERQSDLNATIGVTDWNATVVEAAPVEVTKSDTAELTEQPAAAPTKSRKPALGQQTLGKVGAGVQKAAHAARGVEDNVVHGVQKIRNVSSVVIDEASYDPSLRFVLVAIALFVLFLVMLLLSKIIT